MHEEALRAKNEEDRERERIHEPAVNCVQPTLSAKFRMASNQGLYTLDAKAQEASKEILALLEEPEFCEALNALYALGLPICSDDSHGREELLQVRTDRVHRATEALIKTAVRRSCAGSY